MEFNILDELIEMPKKTDASKAKRKLYVEQMGMLLSEEGFSEKAINYLKSGFTFAGAKPVAIYLQKMSAEQRTKEIEKLLESELFRGGDKLVAFRFGVSLSAFSIEWFGDDQQILLEMMKILPSVSKNKEKGLLKDAPKIYEKYFFDVISEDTELPHIDITRLKEFHIQEYRKMMAEILNKVSSAYRERTLNIGSWIGGIAITSQTTDRGEESTFVDKKILVDNAHKKQETTSSALSKEITVTTKDSVLPKISVEEEFLVDVDVPVKKVVALTRKEFTDAAAMLEDFSVRLDETVATWNSIQRNLDVAREQVLDLQRKLQHTELQLGIEKKQNEQLSEEVANRSRVNADLQVRLNEEKGENTRLEKKVDEVLAENIRLNSIISVYSSDKQNSQSEQLNAIAAKLKSEYRDFKDVENEEMTIDLGENFRFQLQSIFKILIKAGIDVERR